MPLNRTNCTRQVEQIRASSIIMKRVSGMCCSHYKTLSRKTNSTYKNVCSKALSDFWHYDHSIIGMEFIVFDALIFMEPYW